jgi:hypothetical protein
MCSLGSVAFAAPSAEMMEFINKIGADINAEFEARKFAFAEEAYAQLEKDRQLRIGKPCK